MNARRKYEVKTFKFTSDIVEYFNKFQEYTVVGFTRSEYRDYDVLCYKTVPDIS